MQIIKIKKGLNIPLKGAPIKNIESSFHSKTVAVKPSDFIGFQPKLLVKPGDKVLAGTPVFYNKLNEKLVITSPVSGEVIDIVRGDKRVIQEVRIKSDETLSYKQFKEGNQIPTNKDEIKSLLLNSGLWAFIRQRPYDVIPNPESSPRDIYISTFDSSPLAPDYSYILKGSEEFLQIGVDVLGKLTEGKVHIGIDSNVNDKSIFENIKNVEKYYFSGPHPVGNIGVQIHHTNPINKGDVVWYVNIQDLVSIGKLMLKGILDSTRIIAVTGPEVSNPVYVKTNIGACIGGMFNVNSDFSLLRFISGNVLTGTKISKDGYLGFYHHQVTVIPEGKYYEFFGWALPGLKKFSNTRMFFSKLLPSPNYKLDANYHGGERAFVMVGQYEKVFPFDIFPVYLLKAILANDIDAMEELGIYEVSSEDFALCDVVCTSKIEAQEIVKDGLEMLRKEMS